MSKFMSYFQDQDGASAAEYALILAIVGSAIAVAALTLGSAISGAINSAATCVTNHNATSC